MDQAKSTPSLLIVILYLQRSVSLSSTVSKLICRRKRLIVCFTLLRKETTPSLSLTGYSLVDNTEWRIKLQHIRLDTEFLSLTIPNEGIISNCIANVEGRSIEDGEKGPTEVKFSGSGVANQSSRPLTI